MPRVASSSRSNRGPITSGQNHSPFKIPLNDDRQEKAVRLQSRQALHDLQMNQIKAAASPMRKLNNYERAASSSPKTPQDRRNRGKENINIEDGGGLLAMVPGNSMTPMKRVPILANFEEWMKMATDNKINAANSWNFALIDYFHDMSLLKEGDGVNFQKASCTLDGCVKIYTSRVDSVATETGKLLSGLADSSGKKQKHGDDGEGEGEDEEEGEDGVKRPKKRAQRSSEATLVTSFSALQLKKFELEFSVDPLFKKASADFDEGGAKGLLLNHLAIDAQGRIVFDSSDDAEAAEGDSPEKNVDETDEDEVTITDAAENTVINEASSVSKAVEIDLGALRTKFFPNLDVIDDHDICPSLKNFNLGDPTSALDIPFLKDADHSHDAKDQGPSAVDSPESMMDMNNVGFDDDDGPVGFDMPADTGFGEGGEAWARDAALDTQTRVVNDGFGNQADNEDGAETEEVGGFDIGDGNYGVLLKHGRMDGGHEDILNYFDNTLRKNWAGPEHWRIRRMKDMSKTTSTPTKRKEKEPFVIDFNAPLDSALAELIYTPATSNSTISLPKTQWKSKTRNLLPDDKHFNSRQLLRLFLKPKARMGSKKHITSAPARSQNAPENNMDEAFWARQDTAANPEQGDDVPRGDYDADFFQDDGLAFPGGLPDEEDDEFADAREAFSPGVEGAGDTPQPGIDGVLGAGQDGAFGTQLVTQSKRIRPEYVTYARVAKKVDVRRLKEELWRGIGFEEPQNETAREPPKEAEDPPLKFTDVMQNLQSVYPKQAMADISTSYCFICLLHLANEKGLVINSQEGLEELSIRKDYTIDTTALGAD